MSLDDFGNCFLMKKNGQSYLREARIFITKFNIFQIKNSR